MGEGGVSSENSGFQSRFGRQGKDGRVGPKIRNTIKQNPAWGKIIDTVKSGYVLTSDEVKQSLEESGYSRTSESNLPHLIDTGRFEAATGVKLAHTKYRGRKLYFDPSISPEETDMGAVKAKLDQQSKKK